MSSNPKARNIVLVLAVLTASVANWPQDSRGRAFDSGRGSGIESGQPTESAAGNPAQSSDAAPRGQQESMKAAAVPIPIVPFILEYEQGERYFVERITEDPYYLGIEAMLREGSSPVYQVSMVEKEERRKVYYTNSEARAKFLTMSGKTAHVTPIEYKTEENLGELPKHIIAFKDSNGRPIRWVFVQAGELDNETKGISLISRPLKVLHRQMASMAGEGTSVEIGGKIDKAKERPDLSTLPDNAVYEGTFCIDVTAGGLVSGSQSWQVKTAPRSVEVGAEWVLTDGQGNSRRLAVTAKNGDEVTIQEVGVAPSDSAPMTLIMTQTAEGFSLKSISFSEGKRALRLTFEPHLNVAAVLQSGKRSTVAFQIDIGGDDVALKGIMEAEGKANTVELTGQGSFPEWANTIVIKSQVTLSATGYTVKTDKTPSTN